MAVKEYTLKDIAEMAQVSRGTVDRVVHGRGKVSEETYKKVKLILDRIDYKPNLVAQSLRKGELFRIAVLMPDYKYEIYWKRAVEGVEEAIKDHSSIGIRIETFLFNPYKSHSFRQQYLSILDEEFSAVLVAPFFYHESLEFFSRCEEIDLPYFTFNTYIEDANAVTHVGQDLIQSGLTVASLMNKWTCDPAEMLIIHINEQFENSKHMQEKEAGFRQFYNSLGYARERIHVLNINSLKKVEKELLQCLHKHPGIQGIYVTTSKVWSVADALTKNSIKLFLIGYDLLEQNVRHLLTGNIEFLIYQNPRQQSAIGISSIIDYLMFDKHLEDKTLLPIEIVIKENLNTFLG